MTRGDPPREERSTQGPPSPRLTPCFSLQLPAAHASYPLPLPEASDGWVTSLCLGFQGFQVLAPHLSSLPTFLSPGVLLCVPGGQQTLFWAG